MVNNDEQLTSTNTTICTIGRQKGKRYRHTWSAPATLPTRWTGIRYPDCRKRSLLNTILCSNKIISTSSVEKFGVSCLLATTPPLSLPLSTPLSLSLIRKTLSLFFTQKLHYTLWELWTAITLAWLKIRTSCLQQTWGFGGRTIEWCHSNLPRLTLVAVATNRSYFNTKLAITRLRQKIRPWFLHLVRGFRGRPI